MSPRALTVGLLGFCLVLAALVTRNGALALMALPFFAYLGVGILRAPSPAMIELAAERFIEARQTGEGAAVDVRVTIRNAGARVSPVRLTETIQPGMTLTGGSLERWADFVTGDTATLSYSFTAARGTFRWQSLHVAACDPFCLFDTRFEIPAPGEILVRPLVKKFRPFPLRPDSTLHSPGTILADRGGSGTDFWGVREYQAGDPLRRLDWRRTARHPHQFFTKEFELEEIADVGLILDARSRGNVTRGDRSLVDFALDATASLAELFLRRGNRAGLLALGELMTVVYPGYGRVQLNRILRGLADIRSDGPSGPVSLEQAPLRIFGSRALIVIVSPLRTHDWQVFLRLRARGHEGLLISPDPIDFSRGGAAGDPITRHAVRTALLERRLELRRIARLGVRVIDWKVAEPLAPLVRNALRTARGERR
jgi:uncharacterized protein (DUF58 family)